jgi:hypothetical protein
VVQALLLAGVNKEAANKVGCRRACLTLGSGFTALIAASMNGHGEVVQLLAAYGADLNYRNSRGRNAAEEAGLLGHLDIALFMMYATARALAPLQIAAALRMDRCIRWLLRRGVADPADYAPGALIAAATETAHWPSALPLSLTTTHLVRQSLLPWSPERHWLFHGGARLAVRTLQLVEHTLERRSAASVLQFPVLPTELWRKICTFVRRGDFTPTA